MDEKDLSIEENFNFCITNPKWQKVLFIIFLCIGIAFDIGIGIFFIIVPTDLGSLFAALSIGLFLIIIALTGLYAHKKEKFTFQDGVFTYVKVFGKAQSARVEDISCVELQRGSFFKIVFYSRDKQILISFMDEGTAIRSGEFPKALDAFAIPFLVR